MRSDPQATRVYAAEQTVEPGAHLHASDQVRGYLGTITGSEWWVGNGWPPVALYTGRTLNAWAGRLSTGSWYVGLPGWRSPDLEDEARRSVFAGMPVEWPWSWNELTICHELAHVSHLFEVEGRARPAPHGSGFAGRYLHTVDAVIGPRATWRLRRAFERHSVAFAEPPWHDADPLGPDALDAVLWRPYRPSSASHDLPSGTPERQGVLL